jgi:tRNA (guanine37-N1)-methyltransferase
MFAGVGPFSIPIAKQAGAKVTSCEVNKFASGLHEENDRLNKVEDRVTVIRGDAADLPDTLKTRFDRVLMPLPSDSKRFLPAALALVKKRGVIHYYRHVLGENESDAQSALREELSECLPRRCKYGVRKVREVGPRWLEMAAEIRVPA